MKIAVQAWAPDYGSEVEIAWDQGRPDDLDVTAEGVGWKAVSAGKQDDLTWDEVLFIDGVRRTDARVFVTPEDGAGASAGVAVSVGVGAVSCDIAAGNGSPVRAARIAEAIVKRVVAVGGGAELALSAGPGLEYAALPVAGFAPEDLDRKVHDVMRDAEAVLAIELAAAAGSGRLVIVDGPLAKMSPGATAVIGMIKSHNGTYLDDAENALVSDLECGERTPFFYFGGPQRPRYSWYLRLCDAMRTCTDGTASSGARSPRRTRSEPSRLWPMLPAVCCRGSRRCRIGMPGRRRIWCRSPDSRSTCVTCSVIGTWPTG